MNEIDNLGVYEMTVNVRVTWEAHSLSNAGNNGSNRVLPRRQQLADGVITDACHGPILKHYDAVLTAEYLEALGSPLCPACAARDGRRVAALVRQPEYRHLTMERVLNECALCDIHGFLITAKKKTPDDPEDRQRLAKHTLVEYSMALAIPERRAETEQVTTRAGDSDGDGQMIIRVPSRSGQYAGLVRYKAVGIGMDLHSWRLFVGDQAERRRRHMVVLSALRDQLLSPSGAMTATMLPHLRGLEGVIVVKTSAGRAPVYSPLEDDFVARLQSLCGESCQFLPFSSVDGFHLVMQRLIESSVPATPRSHTRQTTSAGAAAAIAARPKKGKKQE